MLPSWLGCVLVLSLVSRALADGQNPAAVAGCYDIQIQSWNVQTGGTLRPPRRVRLDTALVATVYRHSFAAAPRALDGSTPGLPATWSVVHDSVWVVWALGTDMSLAYRFPAEGSRKRGKATYFGRHAELVATRIVCPQ